MTQPPHEAAALTARWEQLQADYTAVRRAWLHCQSLAEKAQLQQQLQHIEQQIQALEKVLQGESNAPEPVLWPLSLRILLGMVLLPAFIGLALWGKQWLSERELAQFFQHNPPIYDVIVTAQQPTTVAGVVFSLRVEWIGRLALATLNMRSSAGEEVAQAILGGEVLPLPNAEDRFYLHVQTIDYEAESVQIQVFQSR